MSQTGKASAPAAHETFWQEVQDDFYKAEAWAKTEALIALGTAKNILANLWSVIAPDQLSIVGKVALFVEGRMAAGDTFEQAMVAGLNELVVEEKTELTKIESSLLNSLVLLHLAKPTPAA